MSLANRVTGFLQRASRAVTDEVRRTRQVIVSPESRPRVESPIFVIGVHRSGTTLLRLILDSHSRIACPPESFFLLPLARALDDAKGAEGLEAMGFDREHVRARLREHVSYFFEVHASAKGKARWADKTPSYVDCLDFIEELYGPGCRYVMVYRHGLDAACSIAAIPTILEVDAHLEACGGDRYAAAARYWSAQCETMLAFQRARASRCFEVRYEHLVGEPEPLLRALFEFLDEPWEPGVLRFNEQPHDFWVGLQDRRAGESTRFEPNVGSYREQPDARLRAMLEQARETLAALGYDDVEKYLDGAREAPEP